MGTRSIHKTEPLTKFSLRLGVLSFGLFVPSFLLMVWLQLFGQSAPIYTALPLLYMAGFLLAGSLFTGIPGCILGMIALTRNGKEGDQNMRRMAVRGTVLSSVGIAAVLFLFILFPAAFQGVFVEPFLP